MNNFLNMLNVAAEFDSLKIKYEPVFGWLDPLEGYALNLLAQHGYGSGSIVEIGSFMGRSTCWLADGAKKRGREKVTAVDHFKGSPQHQKGGIVECSEIVATGSTFAKFIENLHAYNLLDYVNPIVGTSEEAVKNWQSPIRLLFIDGDHSYEESSKDFNLWIKFVIKGGIVAFHDVTPPWEGVVKLFNEVIASNQYTYIGGVGCLRIVYKNSEV